MTDNANFDRQYRLACGPAGGDGFEIGAVSDAQRIPLHISFSIQKSELEAQNTGRVTVWNLNDEHLAVINQTDCVLILRAGYGSRLPLIFSGIISFATTAQEGADRRTEIEVIDNLVEVRDTFISVSYNGTVNWKTVLDDVAALMGVAISYSYNAKFADIANGFSFVGKARDILTKGCECCGLAWSLQNGVLQVKKPDDVMSKEVFLLSASSGLIGSPEQVIVSPSSAGNENTVGWDVEFLLNGAIHISDYVKLESKLISGYFRVYSLEIQGDNISGDWMCKARLLEVKEG